MFPVISAISRQFRLRFFDVLPNFSSFATCLTDFHEFHKRDSCVAYYFNLFTSFLPFSDVQDTAVAAVHRMSSAAEKPSAASASETRRPHSKLQEMAANGGNPESRSALGTQQLDV